MAKMDDMLAAGGDELDTHVDIVLVIDATDSMKPVIEKVKNMARSFHEDLKETLAENKRILTMLRMKVIWFRDFYYDGTQAYGESKFFDLPEEKEAFHDFVSGITAAGGGDDPETSLEALTLAMRSDFDQGGDRRRHVIVLFTDDEAHRFEDHDDLVKAAAEYDCEPEMYPPNMPANLGKLYNAWAGNPESEYLLQNESGEVRLDVTGRRLVLFAPDGYPWSDMTSVMPYTFRYSLQKGLGGEELAGTDVYRLIAMSMKKG